MASEEQFLRMEAIIGDMILENGYESINPNTVRSYLSHICAVDFSVACGCQFTVILGHMKETDFCDLSHSAIHRDFITLDLIIS